VTIAVIGLGFVAVLNEVIPAAPFPNDFSGFLARGFNLDQAIGLEMRILYGLRAAGLSHGFLSFDPLPTDEQSAIREPWAQAVIKRGEKLVINAGYVEQPWRVTSDGKYESLGGETLESIAPFWKP
jgi:hypothetical protein